MSRRSATLVVSGVLLSGLVLVAALLPVPYVVFRPGPLTDVLGEGEQGPIITVEGARSYPTTGSLDLTTVGVTPAGADMDLLTAMRAWVDPDLAVVPRDLVYPGNPTTEEARDRNAAVFSSSQELASVAALRHLGYDVPVEADQVLVREVLDGAASEGVLEPGDQVLDVDGETVGTPSDVVEGIGEFEPGDSVPMTVVRDGETLDLDVPTSESQTDPGEPAIGVIVGQAWDLPVDISYRRAGLDRRLQRGTGVRARHRGHDDARGPARVTRRSPELERSARTVPSDRSAAYSRRSPPPATTTSNCSSPRRPTAPRSAVPRPVTCSSSRSTPSTRRSMW